MARFPETYSGVPVEFSGTDDDQPEVTEPLKIALVLSGGQAPGGHNVISGLFDYIRRIHPDSTLIGFLDGPHGVFSGNYKIIDDSLMDKYRNMGGFDIIGSGRHKIETPEQFASSLKNCSDLGLNGLVVIGGDDSNTNAALLAEYFKQQGSPISVIGCPKTIDGDLKNEFIPVSFGFDTACKTYAQLIGNVQFDALSSQKYYHFIRLMGRSASHITLECALQTRPNVALIGEEVAARSQNLASIAQEVAAVVCARAAQGKDYGVILIPEGLIEFIPEMNALIGEINELLASGNAGTIESIQAVLSTNSAALFEYLPAGIKQQLLLDRDAHGNVQVSRIDTEQLLHATVAHELRRLSLLGRYSGTLRPQFHFFGYEGRCGMPSVFDSSYCYALGATAAALISAGATGLMSCVGNLDRPVADWSVAGVPITGMLNMERRAGKMKPVIKKALVELQGAPFLEFVSKRRSWAVSDQYCCPGPIQFEGDGASDLTETLRLEIADAAGAAADGSLRPERRDSVVGLDEGDKVGRYKAFLEGVLSSGTITSKEYERLLMWRLQHLVTDTMHIAALNSLGWTPDRFDQICEEK